MNYMAIPRGNGVHSRHLLSPQPSYGSDSTEKVDSKDLSILPVQVENADPIDVVLNHMGRQVSRPSATNPTRISG
jgi:hypothetical protein